MRFTVEDDPKLLDERIIRKFLIFPKEINKEGRWLETASIKQKYMVVDNILDVNGWVDIEWVDK